MKSERNSVFILLVEIQSYIHVLTLFIVSVTVRKSSVVNIVGSDNFLALRFVFIILMGVSFNEDGAIACSPICLLLIVLITC